MSKKRNIQQIPRQQQVLKAKPQQKNTVCIAFIHPGQMSAYFTTSLLATMLYDGHTDRHITGIINEWSSANVSASRNTLTANFLDQKDAEWLLWIDSDMEWSHEAVHQLVESADPLERPVVGGLCFGMREGKLFPTIYQLVKVENDVLTTMRVDDFEQDSMVQCAATGAAFLLIHRSVLQLMRDKEFNKTFPWFQETELGGQPAGEDITFGLRVGLCGYPVYVNTAVKIGHHKSHLLTNDMYQAQQRSVSSEPDNTG